MDDFRRLWGIIARIWVTLDVADLISDVVFGASLDVFGGIVGLLQIIFRRRWIFFGRRSMTSSDIVERLRVIFGRLRMIFRRRWIFFGRLWGIIGRL